MGLRSSPKLNIVCMQIAKPEVFPCQLASPEGEVLLNVMAETSVFFCFLYLKLSFQAGLRKALFKQRLG